MKKSSSKNALDKNGFYFIPLGGSEEFGVNLNVYAANGKFLAVDCGLGFAGDRYPGVDLLLPDPQFLEQNRDNLEGLIITHAHEDHIGAVAYLWERLRCPIFASPFTAAVLAEKLQERNVRGASVKIVRGNDTINTGTFGVQFIDVTHSVPDTRALVIETSFGRVLHSGDWNLDPSPVIGTAIDPAPFRAAGDKGIIAYVGDSTNADVPGRSGSEVDVGQGLLEEFKACEGRIAVTLFSSNIGRVISITRAAQKCGRRVCVMGRSLQRMVGIAIQCGYMKDVPEFLQEEDLNGTNDENIVIIVTGSQGEPRSALAKMARGEFRGLTLRKSDTVIFSARAIPGNEININAVKNNLAAAGIRIVTPSDSKHVIHVSGHPCRDEIAEMYQWVRPQTVIPVHGERTQLEAHGAFARQCGVPHVVIPVNGAVIRLAPGVPEIINHVPTGLLAVEPKRLVQSDHASISARRKLQFAGMVHVSVALDEKGRIAADPKINTMGLIDPRSSEEIKIEDDLYNGILDIVEDISPKNLKDDSYVEDEIRTGIRRFFSDLLGSKPVVTVHLIRV